MQTIKLLSWASDTDAKAALLKRAKVAVDAVPLVRTSAVVGELARLNPAALVLDLDKLPSHCREVALALRGSKSARHLPILFAGSIVSIDGLPEKYARLKSELPDIPYAAWPDAPKALGSLLKQPVTVSPVVPPPRVYTTSLAQKLGILAASTKPSDKPRQVALLAAPDGFVALLGDLPDTVKFTNGIMPSTTLALCFIRSLNDLTATIELLTLRLPSGASAWIAYPKRAAKKHQEFGENDVRNLSIAAGLVDYKICSIDATWSALKFAHRKQD